MIVLFMELIVLKLQPITTCKSRSLAYINPIAHATGIRRKGDRETGMDSYDYWLAGNGGIDQAAQDREERIDEIIDDYRDNVGMMKKAADWTDGELSEDQYTSLSLALYSLKHTQPADLIDSDAIVQLYRIAAVRAAQMDAYLRVQAEAQADEEAAGPDDCDYDTAMDGFRAAAGRASDAMDAFERRWPA